MSDRIRPIRSKDLPNRLGNCAHGPLLSRPEIFGRQAGKFLRSSTSLLCAAPSKYMLSGGCEIRALRVGLVNGAVVYLLQGTENALLDVAIR